MASISANRAATCETTEQVESCSKSILLRNRQSFFEGGHQLEKLEFALAVAITRGDNDRCELLRGQIAELGGNIEEPGT